MARIGIVVCVLLFAGGGFLVRVLNTYEDPAIDPTWEVRGSRVIPEGAVTVRWTGTSTLVFSDGETTWMTDGWFSRPGPLDLAVGEIEPDLEAIEAGLARNGVERAAAVFPVHSHYDHAMDAPEVCKRTGAVLLGSESTANIGRGWGLPEEQIRVVADREPIELGRFTLTPIESRHFQFPDPAVRERALGDPEITEPLVPPVGAFEYKVGKAYVLHVSHPLGSFVVVGSAGFEVGGLAGFEADLLFLGTGGLGSQTTSYREIYWRETVETIQPTRLVPIHWDSLTGPIEGPFTGPVLAASFLAEGSDRTLGFLKDKEDENPGLEFLTLPRYDEVVLFSPASPGARTWRSERSERGSASLREERGAAAAPARAAANDRRAEGAESIATDRPLNRSPRTRRRFWEPRFERGSRERERETRAAEVALRRNLIPPATLEARVDQAVAGLEADLPAGELAKAREDAARQAAADAAVAAYLSEKQVGYVDPQRVDMWTTLRGSQTTDTMDRIFLEMEADGALEPPPDE